MACDHKFKNFLRLEKLNFKPETLIVGTFNPAWPEGNYAKWFYGRTSNNYFWEVLPRLYGEDSLRNATDKEWKEFCKINKVAITDLIESIDDAEETNTKHIQLLKTYSDKSISDSFAHHKDIKILDLLRDHPSIKNVYLTRQSGNPLFDNLWRPVQDYCKTKAMKAPMLLTPSGSARFQIASYKAANPGIKSPLKNFIYDSWKANWHN